MSSARPLGRGDLGASLVFIFPLFFAYEVGAIFTSTVNGADFVTRSLHAAVGGDATMYLAIHLGLALAFVAAVLVLRRRRDLHVSDALPVILESAIYALTIGTLIIFVMQKLLGLAVRPQMVPHTMPHTMIEGVDAAIDSWVARTSIGEAGESLVAALGAGVHEELVFRLAGFAGGAALLARFGVRLPVALIVAAALSSVGFSLAHHLGVHGEAFDTHVFVYRLLAGALFAAIFYYRSLAHAVYTHALYDIYVMMVS